MDRFRALSKARLESLKYSVDEIPQGEKESADLFAQHGDDSLVVEVKSRIEDQPLEEELKEAAEGEVVSRVVDLGRQNPLSRTVHKAVKQIRASRADYDGLGVLWFYPDPKLGLPDAHKQMEATLLGIRWVASKQSDSFEPCYLAGRTDFYKYPDLEMTIIDSPDGSKLLLNPYSERIEEARQTRLFKYFDEAGAAVDVHRLESGNGCYVLFGDFDRGDEWVVLSELEKRHPGSKFVFANMKSIGVYTKFKQP